jgi:hypothetical protein
MTNREISRLIEDGHFDQAFSELSSLISAASLNAELLALSRLLSKEIRHKCMALSCNKATDGSPEVFQLEALLREVIKINGEGIYG